MQDFGDCYAVLGLPADADWESVRAHYRRLIGHWHPDRFADDAAQRRLAEARSKQITAAYRALERYRRSHGDLPRPVAGARAHLEAGRPDGAAGPAFEWPGASLSAAGAPAATQRDRPRRASMRRLRAAIVLLALAAAPYLVHRGIEAMSPSGGAVDESARAPAVVQSLPRPSQQPAGLRGISTGSTLGEVYAIQGIPTRTEGDTWHYGKSQIRFAQGVVISWNESPENPLRIARNQPVQLRRGHFKVGSSKEEVRALQGTPVIETVNVWDYGLSRVYFEHNRVVRWEDSPMQPLHVAR